MKEIEPPPIADTITWISVDDKLPCFCETGLVAYKYLCADKNDDGKDVTMGWYSLNDKIWRRIDGVRIDGVLYYANRPCFPEL